MLEISSPLLQVLEAGGTLVVPSAQRATALRLAYASGQLRAGKRAWPSPSIHSWTTWLERQYGRAFDRGAGLPRLLSPAEEWLLWRDAVAQASQELGLAFTGALAEAVRRSVRVLDDWAIPKSVVERAPGGEAELLRRSLELVEARCADMAATLRHRASSWLVSHGLPQSATFAGFSDRTAARRVLMDSWSGRGASLSEPECVDETGRAYVRGCDDAEQEVLLAAAWCRSHLAADPTRRLLVVIPDLARRRQAVIRAFEQVMDPERALRGEADASGVFALEGGRPLASHALVSHALDGLRILVRPTDFSTLSRWLRSSFFGGVCGDRARIEIWLRSRLPPQMDVHRLLRELTDAPETLAPAATALHSALERALHSLDGLTASLFQWSRRFAAALGALGWPGSRVLSSAEQQTRMRFTEALDELGELGAHLHPSTAGEALDILEELLQRIAFEPATGDVAVTVTDALADPVVRYDGIWVTGLHADAWPAPPDLDPFIPPASQRAAGIPAASAAGRLRQARLLLGVWQRRTPELVLSWPRHGADCEYVVSPLLGELQAASPPSDSVGPLSPPPFALDRAVRGETSLQTYEDELGVPWPNGVALPGGTRCIEYQSRCPFRAYAELRLGCVELERPRYGVDVRDRGRLLHMALELLWDRLRDSQVLRSCDAGALHAHIEQCVQRAASECFTETALRERRRALMRETRRAVRLLTALCEIERERPDFRVRHREHRCQPILGGAPLDVRIDRIDELPDGTAVIFDYKTGRPQAQDWLGERVSHPQLLVYLLAAQMPVSAIVAVHLTSARVGYRGIADRKGRVPGVDGLKAAPGVTPDAAWQEQIARWRAQVEKLAQDFLSGRAVADPVEQACRTCHLHGLCRIAELAPADQEGAADE